MSQPDAPGPLAAGALLVALAGASWWVGAYAPTELPSYSDSRREIIGMALMLTLLPPYVLLGVWLGQWRSLVLVEQVRPLLGDPSAAEVAGETIRSAFRRHRLLFAGLGIAMGFVNTEPLAALRGDAPLLAGTISLGQLSMWLVIGMMAGIRFGTARAFHRLAEVVRLELFRPDRLKPLARAGMIDVALIMGAFLLAPLQSLDAEFRWYNYRFALIVALPATAFVLVWPLAPLHRRNRKERDARLAAIDRQIDLEIDRQIDQEVDGEIERLDERNELGPTGATGPDAADAGIRLEALLSHRDRLRGTRTWPLGTALLSRVVLYLVIPPLAWAGAAVVERFVDRLLGG